MSSCISFCGSEEQQQQGAGCDVLIVGLEGSGKSLLCRRLQGLHPKDPNSDAAFSVYTVMTNGIQLAEVACPKGTPFRSILIREVGGQMSPLWPQYYDDCHMVLFVVDVSDASTLATAAVELCDTMQHSKVKGKPICVVLNKQDTALALSRQEVELVMHLHDLERSSTAGLGVVEVSAIPGAFASVKGVDGQILVDSAQTLLDWIIEHKCLALGLSAPSRQELHIGGGMFVPKWAGALP